MAVLIAVLAMAAPSLHAVTQKEMEQARATAALWYLRYANDGSDYLEKLSPATVGELEKSLKAKEKENIKAFKAVKTPGNFASWDKTKLVEYWTVTFFKSPGLSEKGVIARSRVKKKLQAMEVSAPAPKEEAKEQQPGEGMPVMPSDGVAGKDTAAAPVAIVEETQNIEEAIIDTASAAAAEAEQEPRKSNGSTWIYVVVLVVLVGIVVWLVIFASKTMQNGNANNAKGKAPESEAEEPEEPLRIASASEEDEEAEELTSDAAAYASQKSEAQLREKFARALAAKDEEIRALRRENKELRQECMRLEEEKYKHPAQASSPVREKETPAAAATGADAGRREIYLGRVNTKGVFVRADKRLVADKSVFLLTTTDGYTGSYRVIQNVDVLSMALDNPDYYLSGGCAVTGGAAPAEAEGIKTLQSGTAIFEEGCWRVLRKSKIAYL